MPLAESLDDNELSGLQDVVPGLPQTPSRARALRQVAARWLNELICDAYAVHRYGGAGVAALAEFLDSVGATEFSSASHPPGALRCRLMFDWLGQGSSAELQEVAGPFRDLASHVPTADWAGYLSNVFITLSPQIQTVVAGWVGRPAYAARGRERAVAWVAEQLEAGIPGGEVMKNESLESAVGVEPPDVVNACWLATSRGSGKPVERLTLKALENLDFLERWRRAGGELGSTTSGSGTNAPPGALSEVELQRRLSDVGPSGIILTPMLPSSLSGASIDVRLGNRFITFARSAAAAFDSLDHMQDPRSMQMAVEKAWGDVFHLHPGQLVLAATLEYLVMPPDLAAQVITRSSYGRLGLISARPFKSTLSTQAA